MIAAGLFLALLIQEPQETPNAGRIKVLMKRLEHGGQPSPDYDVATDLAKFGEEALPYLRRSLKSDDPDTRRLSARTLMIMGREKAAGAGSALLEALESESDATSLWSMARAVRTLRPDPERAVAILAKKTVVAGTHGAVADALAEYGAAARTAKPALLRSMSTDPESRWCALSALKAIGLEKSDLESMKDLKLGADDRDGHPILVELLADALSAIAFVKGNPGVLREFERNEPSLVELFSRPGDGRDDLRRFLLEQKDFPETLRIDRAKGESWAIVMTWPRKLNPAACFPQREKVVKLVADRAVVEALDQDPGYSLWVQEGTALLSVGGKWGHIDAKGNILIPPAYDQVFHFSGGVASVIVNGKYGYIDLKGKVVAEPKFEWAYEFRKGLGAVRLGEKWGLLDAKGNWVKTPVYLRIDPSGDDLKAWTFDGREGLLDEKGELRR